MRRPGPQPRQLPRELREHFSFLVAQHRRTGTFELGELSAFALEVDERCLQGPLERAANEPVLRLARVVLALRTVSLVLRALDRESLPSEPLLVLIFELTDRASGRREPGRRGRFQPMVPAPSGRALRR